MARGLSRPGAGSSALRFIAALLLVQASLLHADAAGLNAERLAGQRVQYDDDSVKSIIELQRFRATSIAAVRRADGTAGTVTLINLNPAANGWYLLSLSWPGEAESSSFHLENPHPHGPELRLSPSVPGAVRLSTAQGWSCTLPFDGADSLAEARGSGLPYGPLCGGALYLRNAVAGHRTSLEKITDFLRDRVWGGDRIISFVKREFFQDQFIERSPEAAARLQAARTVAPGTPAPADVASELARAPLMPVRLALELGTPERLMLPGAWYPVPDLPGISVSTITPGHIARSVLMGHEKSVNALGAQESQALAYLVAFDLEELELHFVLGTEHPRLDWSDRPPERDSRLPGPDGIASPAPLVTNGMISPADTAATVAAFAGGFKRIHGAFKFGPLALHNHGSHYGFLQEGVLFSKLQPGLATVTVTNDGFVDMRTWSAADDANFEQFRYARQNGVPLIEFDARLGRSVPGNLVNLWGPGNWSGSANEDLRTLRAGLCLQESGSRRFLIYGYFSGATPSAMARTFQAYGCKYALHLDMNALEHTYLALYVQRQRQVLVEHLVQGMDEVDRTSLGTLVPRFLGFPDDRDFFYLTRRERANESAPRH